ncbi:unnamed protein product, partial [Iphiclides podalirius]
MSKPLRLPDLWRCKSTERSIELLLKRLRKDSSKSRANLIDDEALEWLKPRVLIKPDDQEVVPEAGTAIRKDSDEAKAQIAAGYGMVGFDDAGPKRVKVKKSTAEEEEEEEPEAEPAAAEEGKAEEEAAAEEETPEEVKPAEIVETAEGEAEGVPEELEDTEIEEKDETAPKVDAEEEVLTIKPRVKKLANQFNFCERAALTYVFPRRSVETQTVPPPRANYGSTALQCIIFDYYQEDYARKMREKEEEKPKRLRKKEAKHAKTAQQIHDEQLAQRIREAWAILERLVNQNIYDDIAQDYRYWDDPSDEFREGMGSLLPLWRFQFEPMRNHSVCDLQWNPHYQDLFAVAYGSLDFTQQQKQGCLCLYSIKNPAYPEYSVITESPIICLDVYKETPYLICVGRYDGNVCVYNAQLTLESSYQYKSDSVRDKHSNIVWEIRWGARLIDGEASFFSVSGDGRVVQWAVMPGELQATTIIELRSAAAPVPGPDGTLITVNIYRISYNYFNNSIYASCSGDWRVKIWEDGRDEPLFMFELGSPVGDVKWAPYSSTVFAACTADGKVYVYDLNIMKLDKLLSLVRDPPFTPGVVEEKFDDD